MMRKPFKDTLYCWKKVPFDVEYTRRMYNEEPGLGYIIIGYRTESPRLGSRWHTSWVVKHYKNGSIETRNSRYKLVGKEQNG